MSRYRTIFNKVFACLLTVTFLFFSERSLAADGEALFKANCASCHKPDKVFTGPALQGWSGRVPGKDWVYKWVASSSAVIGSGDAYGNKIFNEFGKSKMTDFGTSLSKADVDAILKYVDDYKPPVVEGPKGGGGDDNSLLFGILTLVFALIAFILIP